MKRKKLLSTVLLGIMSMSLVACGSNGDKDTEGSNTC